MRRAAGVLLALALSAAPLAAQVAGRVLDASGQPIAGASVELWSASRRVAATVTDVEGRFTLPSVPDATSVAAHRLGYQTGTLALPVGGDAVIRLQPAPVLLDGVRVTGAAPRVRCPARESPEARGVWERARSRYRMPHHAVLVAAESYQDDVPRERIGQIDGLEPRREEYTVDGNRDRGVDADGLLAGAYGRPHPMVGGAWELAPFAWGLNPHFVSARFGDAHRFSVVARAGAATVLGFCPVERAAPRIEGTLTVTASGELRSVRWRYVTPRPRGEAGGEIDYLDPSPLTGSLLLPRRSLFYRASGGRFHFREDRYVSWRVDAG